MKNDEINGYRWDSAALTWAHSYLLPTLLYEMARLKAGAIAGEDACV